MKDGLLVTRGWIAMHGRGDVTNFEVRAGHARLKVLDWRWRVRANRHPGQRGEGCGFEVHARIKYESNDALVCVTPMASGRRRRRLFAVLNPSIPVPAKCEWVFVGSSFLPEACAVLGTLVNEAGLKRDERVLDLGCGLGRVAYLLSCYLLPNGRYEGLEPVRRWVQRNRAALGSRGMTLRFRHFDVRHALYNPGGRLDPATARFPYRASAFDLAFATSVFQHNRAEVVRNYLREIARVLRRGGRALASCFLLRARPKRRKAKNGTIAFSYHLGDCWTANPKLPEEGIAFLERDFRHWATERGLAVGAQFPGSWRGGRRSVAYQDIVILEKRKRQRYSIARALSRN